MNQEGYRDPTAEQAIKNVTRDMQRAERLLERLQKNAEIHGYEVIGIRDRRTGKEFRQEEMEWIRGD